MTRIPLPDRVQRSIENGPNVQAGQFFFSRPKPNACEAIITFAAPNGLLAGGKPLLHCLWPGLKDELDLSRPYAEDKLNFGYIGGGPMTTGKAILAFLYDVETAEYLCADFTRKFISPAKEGDSLGTADVQQWAEEELQVRQDREDLAEPSFDDGPCP